MAAYFAFVISSMCSSCEGGVFSILDRRVLTHSRAYTTRGAIGPSNTSANSGTNRSIQSETHGRLEFVTIT
eukprot:CAMPEP_0177197384 /NCGR_PEP_ID=MMETSP0367-20130122/24552_1 /TAXON_ID=447022 ORGANISM="Scrippsiella hangoei-like, Strain SHHI-4" /NCGR_SAMPLE_ID=MMETSP0367 /ASSEMBLY_ACC=CAM_ASM_000362 /LENGTH=70 /DNA_ID=CAMNT_0018645543 /DNA_START=40 /DNA_END=248 /DNA_ORIENTATION=+